MQQKLCQVCQTTWVLEYPLDTLDRMLAQDRKMTEEPNNLRGKCKMHLQHTWTFCRKSMYAILGKGMEGGIG
jgi:hypothetical protein